MRWTRGWQTAQSREGPRRFWRGPVTITLSESKAQALETIATEHGISRDQIVQAAVNRWIELYWAGAVKVPLAGEKTTEGTQRIKGTYYRTP